MSEVVLRCRVDLGIVLLSMGEDINQKIFNRQYVDNGFHILHGLMLLETMQVFFKAFKLVIGNEVEKK